MRRLGIQAMRALAVLRIGLAYLTYLQPNGPRSVRDRWRRDREDGAGRRSLRHWSRRLEEHDAEAARGRAP